MTDPGEDRTGRYSPSAGQTPSDQPEQPIPPSARRWARLRAWQRDKREGLRDRPLANRVYRIVVGIIGTAIVVGGLGLIPLPGPGWVIVFVGLAVLASEFAWAARLERYARRQVKAWTAWAGRQPPLLRVLLGLLAVLALLALFYLVLVVGGVPGWIPQSWVQGLPGLS